VQAERVDASRATQMMAKSAEVDGRIDVAGLAKLVLARCEKAALFSEEPGRLTRTFLSAPARTLQRELASWMEQAGLAARVDAAGNLIGLRAGLAPDAPVVMIGSHVDTVPDAGKYDGVLGVLLGLAAVEALAGRSLPFGIEVAALSEEEGIRYRAPFLGSLAICGRFDRQLLARTDRDGITMADAFRAFGLDPARVGDAAYPAGRILAFVEPHIEQGPVLESVGASVGVVSAIAGQSRIWLELHGRAGHAGTVPMEGRRDALAAAAELVLEAERLAQAIPGLRATVGTLAIEPGAVNVIAGMARLSVDVRHANDSVRSEAVAELKMRARALAARRDVELRLTQEQEWPAVPTDPVLSDRLAEAVAATGHRPHRVESGAGHDAAVMAGLAPIAMLFLRSPGGVSHHPLESVLEGDVAVALEVLVRFLELLAARVASNAGFSLGPQVVESQECSSSEVRAVAAPRHTP
jgi:allantoate deiminase